MKRMILLLLLFAWKVLPAQDIAANADTLLAAYSAQHKFSGVVLIAKHNKVVFNKAFGYADIARQLPNETGTQFRAGSLTKMFTSTLILQLAQQGKLALADPVSTYLPGYAWCKGITIQHLLSHTSGIAGNTVATAITPAEQVMGFQPAPALFEPGTQFSYNNFNYILLAYIAEKITGKSYPVLLQENVLQAAGMQYSGIDSAKRMATSKACGYTIDPNTNEWVVPAEEARVAVASGAGALYTTAGDLFLWSKYVQRQLSRHDSLFTQATTPLLNGYGLGWMNSMPNGRHMIGHTGSIPGFLSMLMVFPEDSTTVIFLSNFQDMNTEAFVKNITAVAFGEPFQLPVVQQKIQLPVNLLQEYVGVYGTDAASQLQFVIEQEQLVVLAPGGDRVPLSATAADHFFIEGPDIVINFNRVKDKVASVFVSMGNQTLQKIK